VLRRRQRTGITALVTIRLRHAVRSHDLTMSLIQRVEMKKTLPARYMGQPAG